ncbi:hypothetical protein DOM22_14320 [Bdellovibrio sp. ZAP7]|uniref:hypothetical protein n=1 Tax=Bdellovibrio sp. ZAP7 TaxID=2231053 RepID=UPI00115A4F6C|nr:hypothetical protein [Bdellovibrio sp. ZAP7]QDK46254.1 hypothetical protein DOM22_14320 [Bdellovibrio sp. ZAP7]
MKLVVDLKNNSEPAWSAKIDRWYQLDEVGYAFCEALYQWENLKDETHPDVIFLALPEASNVADFDFVSTGASSPAKFVFTLPNICAAVIFQMLGFSGKVYCLNKGAATIEFAKQEAQEMAKAGKTAWVFASPAKLQNEGREIEFEAFSAK